jgi:hypothetical protein
MLGCLLATIGLMGSATAAATLAPPSDREIIRALSQVRIAEGAKIEVFRDDITIVKNSIGQPQVQPIRVYPLIGSARLAAMQWQCRVYYTETIKTQGVQIRIDRSETVNLVQSWLETPTGQRIQMGN